jgi:hypothetical protein
MEHDCYKELPDADATWLCGVDEMTCSCGREFYIEHVEDYAPSGYGMVMMNTWFDV